MKELFFRYFEVGISCAVTICLLLLLRLLFKKVPKWTVSLLWILIFTQLLIPVQLETPLSIKPFSAVMVYENKNIEFFGTDTRELGDATHFAADRLPGVVPVIPVTSSGNMVRVDYAAILSLVWAVFAVAIVSFSLTSYLWIRRKVRGTVCLENNIYTGDDISGPFLLGCFRPRIYLPSKLDENARVYVIAHEKTHLRRGDHWIKFLAFFALAIHWYNPLVWLGYVLLCRDIEGACDEKTVQDMTLEERKAYATVLLSCSAQGSLAACPVAFGEIGVRQRILQVLRYKKATAWVCTAAIAVFLLVGVCFLTAPVSDRLYPPMYQNFSSLFGRDQDVVFSALSVDRESAEDLFRGIQYMLPETVSYEGREYNIMIYFDSNVPGLCAVHFISEPIPDDRETVRELKTLSRRFRQTMGKPGNSVMEDELLADMPDEEMRKALSRGYRLADIWYLNESASPSTRRYMDKLLEAGCNDAEHYFSLSIGRNAESEGARILMQYSFFASP